MDAYCERQGKAPGSVRFLYDGTRILNHNTPNEVSYHDCNYTIFLNPFFFLIYSWIWMTVIVLMLWSNRLVVANKETTE